MSKTLFSSRWLGSDIGYDQALALQKELVADRLADRLPASLLLLEHAPVYTIGRTRDRTSLGDPARLPHPLVEINRGGQATYHGPGQLVGYPIIDLRQHGKDLHAYLRLLEGVLISTLAHYGVEARRRESLTGVWVEDRKIASIGVGVRKWVTMHGFALNITTECIPPFLAITPCGIDGVRMTCLHAESQERPNPVEVGQVAASHLQGALELLSAPD